MGEDVAPLGVGAELDLVHRQELDLAVQRHRLDGADEILRPGRDNLLFAGDQGDLAWPPRLGDAVVDLPGQQPQRQADHAGFVSKHALHRQVGLAGVGRPEHRFQLRRRAAGVTVAHGWKVGDSGGRNKLGAGRKGSAPGF